MSPSREIELKLEVPAQNLPRLSAGSLLKGVTTLAIKPARLVSVYYDTKKGKLRRQGLSLRVRRIGRRLLQTVKQEHNGNAALFARGEWEQDIDAEQPDLDAARNTPLAPLMPPAAPAPPPPIACSRAMGAHGCRSRPTIRMRGAAA